MKTKPYKFISLLLLIITVTSVFYVPLGKNISDNYIIDDFPDKLPVIYIKTNNGQAPSSRDYYIDGTVTIEHDVFNYGETPMQIKLRGNSTAYQGKKPYHIKLNKSEDLFNMGKSKNWLLLADSLDRSHLRNKLAFDLARNLGMDYVESIYAEVYLNNEYIGLYMFCEQIRIGKSRVDIFDWEDTAENIAKLIAAKENLSIGETENLINEMQENLEWITSGVYKNYAISDYYDTASFNINGGYLIENDAYFDEISKFSTENEVLLMIKKPEYLLTNKKMMDYIRVYIQEMENAIYSYNRYNTNDLHYTEYMDLNSFIDFWIVFQSFKNVEILFKSCYLYKDVNKKIVFGPVWDFDWSSGNHVVLHSDSKVYNKWNNSESQDREYWYRRLYSDPFFMTRLKERWNNVKDIINSMIESIDHYEKMLAPYAEKNIRLWGKNDGMSFKDEVYELKSWLKKRLAWMDNELKKDDPNIMNKGFSADNSIKINYEQINNNLSFAISFDASDEKPAAKASVYINGIRQAEIDVIDNKALYTLPYDPEIINIDGYKKNVITVYKYNDNKETKFSKMNFLTFEFDNRNTIDISPENAVQADNINTLLILIPLLPIICGGMIFFYIYVKKINKSSFFSKR